MLAKLEGPRVRSVRPQDNQAEDCLKDALAKAHDAEQALDAALQVASGADNARSLRMARALASSLVNELEGILAASGAADSEVRLRAGAKATA